MKALEKYLEDFAKSVVNKSKGILKRKDKVVTGNLLNSIRSQILKTPKGYSVEFFMLDYGKFVDKGVSGTKKIRTFVDYEGIRKNSPFRYGKGTQEGGLRKGLDKWIVMRGIAPRDSKGRFLTRETLKSLIATKIYLYGKEGISFFQKPLKLGLFALHKNILISSKEDFEKNITKIIKR